MPTKRSIIFVPFNAEESWLHGSMPFAIRCAQENSFQDGALNLSSLPKGTYLIQVSQDGHQVVKKVVIQ